MLESAEIVVLAAAALLLICRAVGVLFVAMRQPVVVAELSVGIIGGIALSSLGHLRTDELALLSEAFLV